MIKHPPAVQISEPGMNTVLQWIEGLARGREATGKEMLMAYMDFRMEVKTIYNPITDLYLTSVESVFYGSSEIFVCEYRTFDEAFEGHNEWIVYMKSLPATIKAIITNEVHYRRDASAN